MFALLFALVLSASTLVPSAVSPKPPELGEAIQLCQYFGSSGYTPCSQIPLRPASPDPHLGQAIQLCRHFDSRNYTHCEELR